jgi:hypothetical protein
MVPLDRSPMVSYYLVIDPDLVIDRVAVTVWLQFNSSYFGGYGDPMGSGMVSFDRAVMGSHYLLIDTFRLSHRFQVT